MSSFISKLFKSNKKQEYLPPQEDYGPVRGSLRNRTNDYDTGILKSSMRRRGTAPIYEDEFLRNPSAAYHSSTQPRRYQGPRSLPPGALEDSPNASPSSSTDGGYNLEKSFHSEFIPATQPSSSRRKSKKQRTSFDFRPSRHERQRFYREKEESDSENPQRLAEELHIAFKQIRKFKNLFADATGDCRKLKYENEGLVRESHRDKHKIRQLEAEIAQLSQEKRSLETENSSLKSMLYMAPARYPPAFPPTYPTFNNFMTPPSGGLRNQLNNTNTGSIIASGGNSFRPPPTGNNLFEGCGEELAFMSATTTASARLPAMPPVDTGDDEVKVFRTIDETSSSRPPTNSIQSFNSNNMGGISSTKSSPQEKVNENTPLASKKKSPPMPSFAEDPKLALFNQILSNQHQNETPKSRRMKRSNSVSCLNNNE